LFDSLATFQLQKVSKRILKRNIEDIAIVKSGTFQKHTGFNLYSMPLTAFFAVKDLFMVLIKIHVRPQIKNNPENTYV